jgi:hypothetical protein
MLKSRTWTPTLKVMNMAYTTLPADRLKTACEKAAGMARDGDRQKLLAILHLASAALSVNAAASVTVTSDEFLMLAPSW